MLRKVKNSFILKCRLGDNSGNTGVIDPFKEEMHRPGAALGGGWLEEEEFKFVTECPMGSDWPYWRYSDTVQHQEY